SHWIGFDSNSNGHWIYWEDTCRVRVEHSVRFDEREVYIPVSTLLVGEQQP
ncbi:uncharacterized protein BJ212DRAFT_1287926, partial [Suillus subaureus]